MDLAKHVVRSAFLVALLITCGSSFAATIVVNSNADTVSNSDPNCTLREAIIAANTNAPTGGCGAGAPFPAVDEINFSGAVTIQPASALPAITDAVAISASLGTVILDGRNVQGGTGLKFDLYSAGSVVRGLVIQGFPDAAVHLGYHSVSLIGNRIGTDASGLTAVPNCRLGGLGAIVVGNAAVQSARHNVIGGNLPADRNVISGNNCGGIYLFGNAQETSINGNFIGTDATGNSALGNAGHGVHIDGADRTEVGTGFGAVCNSGCNVIAANGGSEIRIDGVLGQQQGHSVHGNYLRIFAGGTAAVGSSSASTFVLDDPDDHLRLYRANVIAGRVTVRSERNDAVFVRGNFIGVNPAGTAAVTGGGSVEVRGTAYIHVGGVGLGEGNVIAGPVDLLGASGVRVQSNFIGVAADGETPLAGGGRILLGDNGSNNVIGAEYGYEEGGNIIAYSSSSGVTMPSGTGNLISRNRIFGHSGTTPELAIDLAHGGPNANDACEAGGFHVFANALQNHPVITSARTSPSATVVQGTLDSLPNTLFKIEFYANPPGSPTPHQAEDFLGALDVTTGPDCLAAFSVSLPAVASGSTITALAIRPDRNTSELSPPRVADAAAEPPKGDFNGDGRDDIVWRNYATGQNAVWFMSGTTLTAIADLPALTNTNWRIEGTARFNADDHYDILLRHYVTGQVAIWLMNGTTVAQIVDLPLLADIDYHIEGTGDFNGDGDADIILRNYFSGANALWLMNGTAFASIVDLPALTNTAWKIESAADFNGDGDTDIVLRNYVTGQNALWLMDGTALSAIVDLPALPNTNYRFDGVGDFNADGKADIVLRNYATGQNAVWLMNGTTLLSIADLPALPNTAYEINGPR